MGKTINQETAEAAQELVRQPIFVINSAPFDRDAEPDADYPHRGNTPWLILIPALQICFEAQTPEGEPICGFFEDDNAKALAVRVYDRCRSDSKLLDKYREKSAWPSNFGPGHKLMQRFITVQPFVPA